MISVLIICHRIILKRHKWSFTPHISYKGSYVLQWHGNLVGPMSYPWRWQFHRLNRSAPYSYVIQNVYLEIATIPCWDPVGVQDMFEKKKQVSFLKHKPPYSTFSLTQDFLGISILPANGCTHQNFIYCLWRASSSCSQEESLLSARAQLSHIFIAFSFLMTFAQPPISDMFQARNIADLTAEATE